MCRCDTWLAPVCFQSHLNNSMFRAAYNPDQCIEIELNKKNRSKIIVIEKCQSLISISTINTQVEKTLFYDHKTIYLLKINKTKNNTNQQCKHQYELKFKHIRNENPKLFSDLKNRIQTTLKLQTMSQ